MDNIVIPAKSKILWLDDDELILASAERMLRLSPWEVVLCKDAAQAKNLIAQQDFAAVLSDQKMPGQSGIEFLTFCREIAPRTTRILITGFLEAQLIRDAVNLAGIFRFISKPWEEAEIFKVLDLAVQHHIQFGEEQELLRRISQKNQMLEQLRSGLEQLVTERTRSIEESKNEVESKQTQIRALVKFIKELSETDSMYELLTAVRKDLRRFHEFADPLFVLATPGQKPRLTYLRGGEIYDKEVESETLQNTTTRLSHVEDRQFLANELARPVHQVLALPLRLPDLPTQGFGSTLFVEHQLGSQDLKSFLQRVRDRLQPVSIVLDRITLGGQLKAASLQWERTFDAIQDPVAIIDLDYKLLRANRHFFKTRKSESCHKTLAASGAPCAGCPVQSAITRGEPQQGQIHVGNQYFEVYSYPIKLRGDSEITTVVNHYVDVSDKKDLYSKMIQNEKMAALGHLAGNIAHELNNPLTGMRSLAQVIKSEIDPSKPMYNDLDEVEKASARCQLIITNLLSFSKHNEEAQVSVVSLNDVVQNTIPLLKTAMRIHNREVELSEEPVDVRVDPHLLQQVVFNLVNNACQAMKEAGTVSISVHREGPFADLAIEDTGVGIPPENIERIFEPFFTTKPEGEGTGIGLSMSKSIVESFGGQMSVKSEINKGSRFTVRLKIVLPQSSAVPKDVL